VIAGCAMGCPGAGARLDDPTLFAQGFEARAEPPVE